jgi:hypothetical protein
VTGVVVAGYVFAVVMPIVGFIIGLTQINRNKHGFWIVVASVVVFLAGVVVLLTTTAGEAAVFPG